MIIIFSWQVFKYTPKNNFFSENFANSTCKSPAQVPLPGPCEMPLNLGLFHSGMEFVPDFGFQAFAKQDKELKGESKGGSKVKAES